MDIQAKRLDILHRVEQKTLSIEEGDQLLKKLETDITPVMNEPPAAHVDVPESEVPSDELRKLNYWRGWWLIPLAIGIVFILLGGVWMYQGWNTAHLGLGFWLSWIPFGLGVLITALSIYSREWVWLHVRVTQKPGSHPSRIAISLPLPIMILYWGLRIFDNYLPEEARGKGVAEMIKGLGQAVSPETPFHVMVNGEDGEHVEVYIG